MITFTGSWMGDRAHELALAAIVKANQAGAGIGAVPGELEQPGWLWCLHLSTPGCNDGPVKLAYGPDRIELRTRCGSVNASAHMHIVCAEIVASWHEHGLCEDVGDSLNWIAGERDVMSLLRDVLKALGTRLVWPTDFMFHLMGQGETVPGRLHP